MNQEAREQTYLKEPEPRFALVLDDRQLNIVEQLLREELRACRTRLEQAVEKERRRVLRLRIKACREILGKIEGMAGSPRPNRGNTSSRRRPPR